MKESKLVELKNKVEGLTNIIRNLIQEIQTNATLAQGTLTAFQYHLGEKKWEKLITELKEKERKEKEKEKANEKKLDLDVG
jgi:hypothetical protein